MEKAPKVDAAVAQGLSAWTATSFAILVADLRHRGLISEDMVDHFESGLLEMEADCPGDTFDAIDHINFVLRGDWITTGEVSRT